MSDHRCPCLVLQLSCHVVVTQAIQVVTQGLINALLEHVLANDVPDGMEDSPSGLKSSAGLEMTVEIVSVSGVIMTTFDTPIDANFLVRVCDEQNCSP